jgi:hypothetical protein
MPSPKPPITIRRPAVAPPPTDVERFVSAGESPHGAKSGSPETAGAPGTPARGKGIHVRKDGRVRRRITAYLPPDLAQRLSVEAAATGREASEIVSAAVAAYLTSSDADGGSR